MDITQLILDDHADFRRIFAEIEEIGRGDLKALEAVWGRLHARLDTHAEAEEILFYPEVLKLGTGQGGKDDAAAETIDAIEDHNDIRDTAKAVDEQPVGSDAWFAAINACNKANSEHMAEEEREALTDFRLHAGLEMRHDLAVKFAGFEAQNAAGVVSHDLDPKAYVAQNS